MNERSYRGRSARARRPEKRAAVAAAGATRSKRSFFDLRINDSHLGFQLPRSQRLHLHPHLELSTVFDPAGVLTCVIAQQQLCHSAYQHSGTASALSLSRLLLCGVLCPHTFLRRLAWRRKGIFAGWWLRHWLGDCKTCYCSGFLTRSSGCPCLAKHSTIASIYQGENITLS